MKIKHDANKMAPKFSECVPGTLAIDSDGDLNILMRNGEILCIGPSFIGKRGFAADVERADTFEVLPEGATVTLTQTSLTEEDDDFDIL